MDYETYQLFSTFKFMLAFVAAIGTISLIGVIFLFILAWREPNNEPVDFLPAVTLENKKS